MTETTATAPNPTAAPQDGAEEPVRTADVLIDLVVILLAPMFLCAAGGNINLARAAAFETLAAYGIRNQVGLLAVVQIVACGLASLASLSLSMEDGMSVSMTLRLRGNANALNRGAEQGRRALEKSQASAAPAPSPVVAAKPTDPAEDARYEAAAVASLAATRKRLAAVQTQRYDAVPQTDGGVAEPGPAAALPAAPIPAATPRTAAPPTGPLPAAAAGPTSAERQHQEMWAAAMAHVAGESVALLPGLPATERRIESARITALSSAADALLSGAVPPRPRPGALSAVIRPNPV